MQPGFGNAWLENTKNERHQGWALGGVAELVHNAADAQATTISIRKFPRDDATWDDPHFGLRFDDDGEGMLGPDVVKMLSMHSDKDFSSTVGKVGGYGVGFKAGSMVLAQTAVVLTWKTLKEGDRVLTIGVLSNEPYESRGDVPTRLYVSIDTKTDAPTDGCTDADYSKVLTAILSVNRRLPSMLAQWIDKDQTGPHGTTVLLLGFRKSERLFDFDRDPHDAVLTSRVSRSGLHTGNKSREAGDVVKMDWSLRSFLSLMFLHREGDNLRISLFGKEVARHRHWDALKMATREKQTIEWAFNGEKHQIEIMLGEQTDESKNYGCMLYFEGALISSYTRTFANLSKVQPREERDRFGAVLVVNLLKKHGFLACPEKISFRNQETTNPCWGLLKARFDSKIDSLMELREKQRPERGLFRQVLSGIKGTLCGMNSAIRPQGPLRGVLFPVIDEDSTDKIESYSKMIKHKIALSTIAEKVDNGDYDHSSPRQSVANFRRDLDLVFDNAIKWHAKGRWIPDTVDDLDVNDCSEQDIIDAGTKPFLTTHTIYTLRSIFNDQKIPDEFMDVVIANQGNHLISPKEFKQLWDPADPAAGFEVGTTILLPHRQDVKAVRQAKKLRKFAQTSCDDVLRELKSLRSLAGAPKAIDHWITCDQCHKERRCTQQQSKRFGGEGVPFWCEDIKRSCSEPTDADNTPLSSMAHFAEPMEEDVAPAEPGPARAHSKSTQPPMAVTKEAHKDIVSSSSMGVKANAQSQPVMNALRRASENDLTTEKRLHRIKSLVLTLNDFSSLPQADRTEDPRSYNQSFTRLNKTIEKEFPDKKSEGRKVWRNLIRIWIKLYPESARKTATPNPTSLEASRKRAMEPDGDSGDDGSAAAQDAPSSKRTRKDSTVDVPYPAYAKEAVNGEKARPCPPELAPAQVKHYPNRVNEVAERLDLPFRVGPCTRHPDATRPCDCATTWNNFARSDPAAATRLKEHLRTLQHKDICISQGGLPPTVGYHGKGPESGKKVPVCPQELRPMQRHHYPEKVAQAAAELGLDHWKVAFSRPCSRWTGAAEVCKCGTIWHDLARSDASGATRLSNEVKKRREAEIRRLQGGQ
eukprot:m.334754 g.334754  ORF g.334754 m.334754 type:complete len:1093 (+) comp16529_c0_seq22:164-3442(+)